MFNYSATTILILVCMIATGAARVASVKLFYQLGFNSPLTVTLLYLLGQALSLVVYYYWESLSRQQEQPSVHRGGFQKVDQQERHNDDQIITTQSTIECGAETIEFELTLLHHTNTSRLEADHANDDHKSSPILKILQLDDTDGIARCNTASCSSSLEDCHDDDSITDDLDAESHKSTTDDLKVKSHQAVPHHHQQQKRRGSFTGLTEQSHQAVSWVHKIRPWYLKPVIPALFNLCNSSMRLASYVYVAASVAELLISGLELALSVLAARIIRQRLVSKSRWAGVGVVVVGLLVVGMADIVSVKHDEDKKAHAGDDEILAASPSESYHGQLIGIVLIVGECITSVLQDISEEIFMAESDFPAMLLLGMEGLLGFVIGIFLYAPVAHLIGEDPRETFDTMTESWTNMSCVVYLVLLFTLTGIFNITATAVTSSMTRNVWKNVRTLCVWVMGLVIFTVTGNDELGEVWRIPESLIVPAGSVIMFAGICLYYKDKPVQ